MTKSWTSTITQNPNNPNEAVLIFTPEMAAELGWTEDSELEWSVDLESGQIVINKS